MTRQYVDRSFSQLCSQLTSTHWLISPVLLAADEFRTHWTHHHHHHYYHHQQQQHGDDDDDDDDDDKKR